MAYSADYKTLIKQFSIVVSVFLVLYVILVRPLAQQGMRVLDEQINEAVIQLEKYIPESEKGVLPKEEFVQTLEASLLRYKRNYGQLKEFIDPAREYLPEGTQEAGLYFIEQLHITTKRLNRQGNTLKIKIPDSFGFSEEMPEDAADVALLLKELDIVDRITTLLMEEGVKEISLVKPLSVLEQRDEVTQELFYRELPLHLSFLCNSSTLVNLLYQMKNFSPVLFIKDIIIKRQEGLSLQVEILLSRLIVA